jgi:hypothetical protein
MERALSRDITAAEERAKSAGVPPILRNMIGPDAAPKWAALGDNIAVKREVIRAVTTITIQPARHRHGVPVEQRVTFGGPIADTTASLTGQSTS